MTINDIIGAISEAYGYVKDAGDTELCERLDKSTEKLHKLAEAVSILKAR